MPSLVLCDDTETRYFSAIKVNPTDHDTRVFTDGCIALGAKYYGYSIIPMKTKISFEGFIVMESDTQEGIERLFPNFLVTRIRA
jgi:hypothetical protein